MVLTTVSANSFAPSPPLAQWVEDIIGTPYSSDFFCSSSFSVSVSNVKPFIPTTTGNP